MDKLITPNFYLSELTRSNTAARFGIRNTPSETHLKNLTDSAKNLWQPVRDMLGVPVLVSSGYRSPALNAKIGGARNSAHSHGFAIDFSAPAFGDSRKIAEFLVKELRARGIKFDQLILEFPGTPGSWIHLGYKRPGTGEQRNQVLTAKKVKGKTVYLSGLQ